MNIRIRKFKNSEQGSVPFALMVLFVAVLLITITGTSLGRNLDNLRSSMEHEDSARVAEAGLEHIVYEVRRLIESKSVIRVKLPVGVGGGNYSMTMFDTTQSVSRGHDANGANNSLKEVTLTGGSGINKISYLTQNDLNTWFGLTNGADKHSPVVFQHKYEDINPNARYGIEVLRLVKPVSPWDMQSGTEITAPGSSIYEEEDIFAVEAIISASNVGTRSKEYRKRAIFTFRTKLEHLETKLIDPANPAAGEYSYYVIRLAS